MNRAALLRYGRPLARTLALIVAALLTAAWLTTGAVVLVLRSDAATEWTLRTVQNLVPGLSIAGARGNLIDGLHVDTLRLDLPDLDLIIAPLDLRLSWAHLLHLRATVAPLHIGRLSIEPRGPDTGEPTVLPRLASPLSLHVPQLLVDELVIRSGDTVTTLRGIRTEARWLGTELRLGATQLGYEQFALDASGGRLRFSGNYPLNLTGVIRSADLPAPARVVASGDLRALKLDAAMGGTWPLYAQATLRTLDENLPFALAVQLAQTVSVDTGIDVVSVRAAALEAGGDLDRSTGTLRAVFHDTRYSDSRLTGDLDWEGGVLGLVARLALPSGQIESDCRLRTAASDWSCDGAIAALPLTPWLNGLPGTLSTPFRVAGRTGMPIDLQVELPDITGNVDTLALTGAVRASSPDLRRWEIPQLALRAGANQLTASGWLDERSQLRAILDAPQLAQLYAGLAGSASGSVDISGAVTTPTVRGELTARDLRLQSGTDVVQLQRGQAQFAVADLGRASSELTLKMTGLAARGASGDLDLTLRGTRVQHRWQLALTQSRGSAEFGCNGALNDAPLRYRLECPTARGKLALSERRRQPWHAQTPLLAQWNFERREGGVEAFCLRADPAALCVKPGVQYRQHRLQPFDATLSQLPLRWWRRALPERLRLANDPHVSAELHFMRQQPLQLQARAQLEPSEWRWSNGELALDAVTASADIDARRAHLTTAVQSAALGRAGAELTILDPAKTRQLQGRATLAGLQLAAFGWALPDVESISGQIDGAVNIAGTAAQPLVSGQFAATGSSVQITGNSEPITDLGARLNFDNQRATLQGQFRLGAGRAQLDGNASWASGYQDWRASLHLRGDKLEVEPIAGSHVVFAPDLIFDAAPDDLRLHGQIQLEKADIRLQRLPPETVNPSRDTVVSGREVDDTALPLTLDIALNLGRDTHFDGFGAEVDLGGQLQLHQEKNRELAATGRVNVTKGRYRAYGQRLIVRRGQFIFTGNLDNPDLNLEAIRELPPGNTDVVGLRVTGSLRDPVAQLFSEQGLSESDTAYYLLTGTRRDTASNGGGQFSAGGTLLSLGLSRSEDQAAKLAEKFGIRGLQLGTTAGNDGSTEAEVSGYLFRDLYVRYGRSLGQSADSVTLQYQLSPNLMIQTISGIEEALDLIYTFTLD